MTKALGYDLTRKLVDQKVFKDKRGRLRNAILAILKERGKDCEPYLDMVEQLMSLWDDLQHLIVDVARNGVRLENGKDNPSVKQKVATNKQIMIIYEKLGISAMEVKSDDGEDI